MKKKDHETLSGKLFGVLNYVQIGDPEVKEQHQPQWGIFFFFTLKVHFEVYPTEDCSFCQE